MFKLKRDELVRPTLKKKDGFVRYSNRKLLLYRVPIVLELPRNNYPYI